MDISTKEATLMDNEMFQEIMFKLVFISSVTLMSSQLVSHKDILKNLIENHFDIRFLCSCAPFDHQQSLRNYTTITFTVNS